MNDDDHLIDRYRNQQDFEALERVLARYEEGVYAFMRRMLSHQQDAEDASQRTFTNVVRKLDSYRASGKFKSWLFQIACNEARQILRQRKRRQEVPMSETFDPSDKRTLTPDKQFRVGERHRELYNAVENLPKGEREVVTLRLQLDCTFAEIAEMTHTPLGTVLGRMRTATNRLRGLIQEPT